MDFVQETQKAITKVTEEKLPEMIEKATQKMVEEIVESTFRYGKIKDAIKQKIENSINVNLQEFDLIDYNALIAKTINDNLLNQVNLQPILDMTQDIIGFVEKKQITLQEIADIFIDASRRDSDGFGEGEITFIVEIDEEHKWLEIYADINPNIDKHKCSINFIFSTNSPREGKIFVFRNKDIWDNKPKEITPSRMAQLRGVESKIFRLYSAQVQIINYTEEINTYWGSY